MDFAPLDSTHFLQCPALHLTKTILKVYAKSFSSSFFETIIDRVIDWNHLVFVSQDVHSKDSNIAG